MVLGVGLLRWDICSPSADPSCTLVKSKRSSKCTQVQELALMFFPGMVQLGFLKSSGVKDCSAKLLSSACRFWALLSELLPVHSIGSLPFSTCFSLGMGKRHFNNGQVRTLSKLKL